MAELQHSSNAILIELDEYFSNKQNAKKSGKESLSSFISENESNLQRLTNELRKDINQMLSSVEKYGIELDNMYNYKNKTLAVYKTLLSNSKNDLEQSNTIKQKIEELKIWYTTSYDEIKQSISLMEQSIIKSKTSLAKVEKRRLLDLRPKHLMIGIMITLITTLITGMLINFLYLLPLKGVEPKWFTILVLILFSVINLSFWIQLIVRHSTGRLYLNDDKAMWKGSLAGFVSAFSDTLGIGSFATATAIFKLTNAVKPHELKMLPGTLNVGLAFSQIFAGILFLGAIDVDIWTLILFCAATVCGTIIGSIIVEKLHRKVITFVIAVSLFITAILMILVLIPGIFPHGNKTGLTQLADIPMLILGLFLFVLLGALMSFGVGLYAPSMVVISLLGLNPITSIPIMTCAAAISQQAAARRYVKTNNYIPKVSFNMAISGLLGVLAAFIIVFVLIIGNDKNAEATLILVMRSISVVVVLFTAISLLLNYIRMQNEMNLVKVDDQELLTNSSFSDKYIYFLSTIKQVI